MMFHKQGSWFSDIQSLSDATERSHCSAFVDNSSRLPAIHLTRFVQIDLGRYTLRLKIHRSEELVSGVRA